ncbi:hypothetical protein GCM10010298_69160 [Streptomyces microflavus]|nr:hypothetical protein GCM10010298_69160 [Streptomyces microflavus]
MPWHGTRRPAVSPLLVGGLSITRPVRNHLACVVHAVVRHTRPHLARSVKADPVALGHARPIHSYTRPTGALPLAILTARKNPERTNGGAVTLGSYAR